MKSKLFSFILLVIAVVTPSKIIAQELHNDFQGTYRGKVLEIVNQEQRLIPGTDTEQLFQTIRAEILEGERKGEIITIENDYLKLDKGNKFYFNYFVDVAGFEHYAVTNIDRTNSLIFLTLVFVCAIVLFGGKQGVRSIIALLGSFLSIFYILLPGLLNGWNPITASFLIASGILFVAIFFTHGFNKESLVAYGGTMFAVLITSLFATFAVSTADLSGFATDETTYLNFTTRGALDFTALLLGGIIIGILGVLDDIAITQSAVVSELYDSNPGITRTEVYKRAIRIGREHVSALVNTLVLAYTGVSLPLLLYFYASPSGFNSVVNTEIIATEIVRAIVGSVGLILTVPVVTLLAAFYLKGYKPKHHHHIHTHTH